jgi:4-carboxymuconolactone decarboxylase
VNRFPQLEPDDLDDAQRRAIEPVLRYAGGIVGPFNASLRSARLTELQFALGNHLLFETTLPRQLVEMAVLIRARWSSSQLEWHAHERRGREEGLRDEIVEALRLGERPPELGDDEAVLTTSASSCCEPSASATRPSSARGTHSASAASSSSSTSSASTG